MNKKRKLKIGIFIDHDIIIRHFLHSGVLKKLSNKHKVDFILPPIGYKRTKLDPKNYIGNSKKITLKVNNFRRTLWARLRQVIILRSRFGEENKNIRKNWLQYIPLKERILQTLLGLPIIFKIYRLVIKIIEYQYRNKDLINIIYKGKYDLIINPGVPDGIFFDDLQLEAKRFKIPLIYIMNSWDNPCVCPLVNGQPDLYLAWGPQSANLANEYLKIDSHKIIQFGAAQFEVYKNNPKINRLNFCKINQINPKNKIILYAGSNHNTDEFSHLKALENSIESGFLKKSIILYRPHPWGGGGSTGNKILNHDWKHVRIESNMKNYLENLQNKGYHLTFPSYEDTNVVLCAVDCVISPLSTILLESLIVGKPTLCFRALDEISEKNKRLKIISKMPHFKDFVTAKEIILADNLEQLVKKVPLLINQIDNPIPKEDINKLKSKYICHYEEKYEERLVTLVEKLIN